MVVGAVLHWEGEGCRGMEIMFNSGLGCELLHEGKRGKKRRSLEK